MIERLVHELAEKETLCTTQQLQLAHFKVQVESMFTSYSALKREKDDVSFQLATTMENLLLVQVRPLRPSPSSV